MMAPKVPTILVPRSAHDDAQDTALVSAVVDFVNAMLFEAAYERGEIPREAMLAYHTDYYLGQVMNGGHEGFVDNGFWEPRMVEDIAAGLDAMRAEPYRGIFSDLRRLVEAEGRPADDPAMGALDDRFFAQDAYETFSPAIARWLRGLPVLEVVADADLAGRMRGLAEANAQGPARLAAREAEARRAVAQDPIHVAARLLCERAGCLPVHAVTSGDPSAVAPDGRMGGWTVDTGDDTKMVFLFDDVAILCDTYLADGTRSTRARMERYLAETADDPGNLSHLSLFSRIEQREIARIPARLVAAAVEAAKDG